MIGVRCSRVSSSAARPSRPPTGVRSCKLTKPGHSSKRRPSNCPTSISTASDRRRTRGVEAPGTDDWDVVCAHDRKTPPKRVRGVSRDSLRTCGAAIDRAILRRGGCSASISTCHTSLNGHDLLGLGVCPIVSIGFRQSDDHSRYSSMLSLWYRSQIGPLFALRRDAILAIKVRS